MTDEQLLRKKAIGERIRKKREAKGLTLVEVARMLEVDRSLPWHWEHGDTVPRRIADLAKLLGCTVGSLYGERAA